MDNPRCPICGEQLKTKDDLYYTCNFCGNMYSSFDIEYEEEDNRVDRLVDIWNRQ